MAVGSGGKEENENKVAKSFCDCAIGNSAEKKGMEPADEQKKMNGKNGEDKKGERGRAKRENDYGRWFCRLFHIIPYIHA